MSPEDMEIERARGQPENTEDSVQRKKNESKKSIETVESEPLVQHTKRSFTNSLDCEQSCDRSRRASLEVVRKKRRTSTGSDRNDPIPDAPLSNRTDHLPSGVVVPAASDHIRVVFEDESEPIGDVPPNINEDYPMADADADADMRQDENGAESDVRPRRDHRIKMRRLFAVCFTGNSQESFVRGKVLAECSDEED